MAIKDNRVLGAVIMGMAGAVIGVVVTGSVFLWSILPAYKSEPGAVQASLPAPTGVLQGYEEVVIRVAAEAGPAIVGIYVEIPSGALFQETGSGSGIVMGNDGYILTNNHVVSDSQGRYVNGTRITVYLAAHDKPYAARLVGRDPQTDLAVLKIEASNLPVAVFGDSDAIRVGQMTIAIGNPAGLEFMGSVTSGVISGLDRQVVLESGADMRLIQTDAAINPGNSGGALLDSSGRVIGINSAGLAKNEYEGVNFAIPSNLASRIYTELKNNTNTTRRPYLGVTILPDAEYQKIREQYGLPTAGVRIETVAPGGPAEASGLVSGDVIISWNGNPIDKLTSLTSAISGHKPGETVVLTVFRSADEKEVKIQVVLGERFD